MKKLNMYLAVFLMAHLYPCLVPAQVVIRDTVRIGETQQDDMLHHPLNLPSSTNLQIIFSPTENCGCIDILGSDKDSFVRGGNNDRNEGANYIMRLQDSGNNRALVAFNLAGINLMGLKKATLVLTIYDGIPPKNWGSQGRFVDVHRLTEDWAEGNGKSLDLPPPQSTRGSGPGVTWACAIDAAIENQKKDCDGNWMGGINSIAPKTAPGQLITNDQSGQVSWDVTQDVADGVEFGWLIKKELEGQSGHVRFYTREGAQEAGDMALAPTLIIEVVSLWNGMVFNECVWK